VEIGRLTGYLTTLQRYRIELVVVDTPPALTEVIQAAVSVANVVLIPARPSPHDLRSIGTIVEMVERMGKLFCFVVNGATPRTTIATDAVRALAQHGRVAPVTIHARIDFAASMIDGRTVGEVSAQSRSTQEIAELWTYVNSQLRRSGKGR
jgi:chromosome partitioning protein